MNQDSPLLLLGLLAATGYIAKLWLDDYRAARRGQPNPRALPGAVATNANAVVLAVVGAIVLLALETLGESALGLTEKQSEMTVLYGLYTFAAAFGEELIFRGFLVIENRGRAKLIASVVGASVLFTLIHPFLLEWRDGALHVHLGAKAWFSTALVFASSLWFYTVRFWKWNPSHSLVPCIAAHLAKNLGVFVIKYAQGFVSGWW